MDFGLWLRVRLSDRLARARLKPSAATCGGLRDACLGEVRGVPVAVRARETVLAHPACTRG